MRSISLTSAEAHAFFCFNYANHVLQSLRYRFVKYFVHPIGNFMIVKPGHLRSQKITQREREREIQITKYQTKKTPKEKNTKPN